MEHVRKGRKDFLQGGVGQAVVEEYYETLQRENTTAIDNIGRQQ